MDVAGISDCAIRVSYVITTRNRAQYLERTLTNVRDFIESQDELIIIDGESTDDTQSVVAQHEDIVTTFISEADTGEAHALNKALFRARGRFIKLITDDDYFYPDAMRELVRTMELHSEVDAILCGGEQWIIEHGEPVFSGFRFLPPEVPATPEAIYHWTHIGLGIILRKSAVERTGGVSSNYASVDGDLICRLIVCRCNLRYLDINLYKWFVHPHSGFNKSAQIKRDHFLIALRLGHWDEIFSREPEELAEIIDYGKRAGALSQLRGNRVAYVLARTRLKRVLDAADFAIRACRKLRQIVHRLFHPSSVSTQSAVLANPEWSGILR